MIVRYLAIEMFPSPLFDEDGREIRIKIQGHGLEKYEMTVHWNHRDDLSMLELMLDHAKAGFIRSLKEAEKKLAPQDSLGAIGGLDRQGGKAGNPVPCK